MIMILGSDFNNTNTNISDFNFIIILKLKIKIVKTKIKKVLKGLLLLVLGGALEQLEAKGYAVIILILILKY